MSIASPFEDGSNIIEHNPNSAFNKILCRNYRVFYHIERDLEPLTNLIVKVVYGEIIVGEADFTDDGSIAYCQNIEVHPDYRRQGVATAIYVFAEKVFGKPLIDFWQNDSAQSLEAKALWAQTNRPFGHVHNPEDT